MDFDLIRTMVLATFVSQLVTMSVIAPRRIYLLRREIWTKYPADQYPHLYPIGVERVKRQQSIANFVDGVIFCLGISLLIALLMKSAPTHQIAFVAMMVGMVQIVVRLPRLLIDIQIQRAYKASQPPPVRSATFKNWTLGDFVSPAFVVLGVAVTVLGLCIAVLVALSQQGGVRLILMTAIIGSMDAYFLFRMIRAISRPLLPRIDPYAAADDLYRLRKRQLRSLFWASTLFALVTTIELLTFSQFLAIRSEYIAIGLSFLMQNAALRIAIVAFRQLRTRDFSRYRDSADASSPSTIV